MDAKNEQPFICIHSDHGEEFKEHGGTRHDSSLYEEQIHVPLAFSGPGIAPGRSDFPVELIDIGPTLCNMAGVKLNEESRGHSLVPLLLEEDENSWPPPIVFSQFRSPQFGYGNLDAVLIPGWKLIHNRKLDLYELFDLRTDPRESKNLAARNPSRLTLMKKKLATIRAYAHDETPLMPAASKNELLLKSTDEQTWSPQEQAALRAFLRRPMDDDHGYLIRLMVHPDQKRRHAALVHLMTYGPIGLARDLLKRLQDAELPYRSEGEFALAILGEKISLSRLPLHEGFFQGQERIIPMLARFLSGDLELGPPLYHLIGNHGGDVDLDTLCIRALLRAQDPGILPALYARSYLGMNSSEQGSAIMTFLPAQGIPGSGPILRRIFSSRDHGLRREFESKIKTNSKLKSWAGPAKKAEELCVRAQSLVRSRATVDRAMTLLQDGMKEMLSEHYFDYGFILDMSLFLNSWNRSHELKGMLPEGMAQNREQMPHVKSLIERLCKIAATRAGKVKGTLTIDPSETPAVGESGRIPLLVRLKLEPKSSALVGSFGPESDTLQATILKPNGTPLTLPTKLPLPTTGVLPGESKVLAAPVEIPPGLLPPFQIVVQLRRGDVGVLDPFVVEVPKQKK